MSNLKFDFLWNSWGNGVLSPKDLRFFYYDIAIDNISGLSKVYEWDDTIISFLNKNQLIIEDSEIIEEEKVKDNTILFTILKNKKTGKAKETKTQAFFRHLRNAFAHYNIKRDNDIFYIKDFNNKKQTTMIGAVNSDLLKQFCFLFLDQREDIMLSLNNTNQNNI